MKSMLAISIFLLLGFGCKSKVTNEQAVEQAVEQSADQAIEQTVEVFKNVDVNEAKTLIAENKDLIILDVRTPEETDLGTIPNAILIDYRNSNFDAEIAKLDRSKPYLVYCKSGGRSVGASTKMMNLGFTNITNLKGGYTAWSEK
jgi:rhodanese-related sulfurtransferase